MGLDSVLVITDEVDENLLLASRNLPNVLVVEPRYADPLSLVHLQEGAGDQGRDRRSSRRCWHERRTVQASSTKAA